MRTSLKERVYSFVAGSQPTSVKDLSAEFPWVHPAMLKKIITRGISLGIVRQVEEKYELIALAEKKENQHKRQRTRYKKDRLWQ